MTQKHKKNIDLSELVLFKVLVGQFVIQRWGAYLRVFSPLIKSLYVLQANVYFIMAYLCLTQKQGYVRAKRP